MIRRVSLEKWELSSDRFISTEFGPLGQPEHFLETWVEEKDCKDDDMGYT